MELLKEEDWRKISPKHLAEKHNCSAQYVNFIVRGKREAKTTRAKGVLQDAHAIVDIYNGKVNDNTHRLVDEKIRKNIAERKQSI